MKQAALSLLTLLFALPAFAKIECTPDTIQNVYISKFDTVYTDAMRSYDLRTFAQELCKLEQQREDLQLQVRKAGQDTRENFNVCPSLDPKASGTVTKACVNAHSKKINDLIDQCQAVVGIGHTPNSVMIPIDEVRVENACLRGIVLAIKSANKL